MVERPGTGIEHLCLDEGLQSKEPRGSSGSRLRGHIRRVREEKLDTLGRKRYSARRRVVERTVAWLSKCRTIPVRYDKKAFNYIGLIHLASALLWYRRQEQLKF